MRIRSIKPEFWRSRDVSDLDVPDRLLYIGLWSYVDDNGVGLDSLALVAADLFANDLERDSSETFARVSRGLQNLSEAGRIVRYTLQNKGFLYVVNWELHQRIDKPNKPRYPHPTREGVTIRETLATVSRQSPETLAPGTGEQGNRGTGEQGKGNSQQTRSSAPLDDQEFDLFWSRYPRKVAKAQARTAYRAARRKVTSDVILQSLAVFTQYSQHQDPKYIKHPATWLRAESWHDDPESIAPAGKPNGQQDTDDFFNRAMQRAREADEADYQRGITA